VNTPSDRDRLIDRISDSRDHVINLCRELIRIDSQNPPSDTSKLVTKIESIIGTSPHIEHRRISPKPPITNLVAKVAGNAGGRRLVFNGHLDTFPIGNKSNWSVGPLSGDIKDGKIFGRGACDMKAGVAGSVMAFLLLAEFRDSWSGEAVLTLVGDEETGGAWGTKYLLEHVEEASGDALINGDTGSPEIVRFGEKGLIWLSLETTGKAGHGAHVHLGRNAIRTLLEGLEPVLGLQGLNPSVPDDITRAVREADQVYKAIGIEGEGDTVLRVTTNLGQISGGININTIPDSSNALVDIRIPPGITTDEISDLIKPRLDQLNDLQWSILTSCEANWTDPESEIITLTRENAKAALGRKVATSLRPGFSDARFYREKNIPSVVYGVTPHNMGAADEFATIDDIQTVFSVHSLTAFDFLSA